MVGVFYPPHLAKFGEHDHNGGVVFPQHPPEVLSGLCQWPLAGYVRFLLPDIYIETTMSGTVEQSLFSK